MRERDGVQMGKYCGVGNPAWGMPYGKEVYKEEVYKMGRGESSIGCGSKPSHEIHAHTLFCQRASELGNGMRKKGTVCPQTHESCLFFENDLQASELVLGADLVTQRRTQNHSSPNMTEHEKKKGEGKPPGEGEVEN